MGFKDDQLEMWGIDGISMLPEVLLARQVYFSLEPQQLVLLEMP